MNTGDVIAFLDNVPGLKKGDFFLHSKIRRWVWTFAAEAEKNTLIAFQLDLRTGDLRSVTAGIHIDFYAEDNKFYMCSQLLGDQPRFKSDYLTPDKLQEIVNRNLDVQKKAYTELAKRIRSVLIDEL